MTGQGYQCSDTLSVTVPSGEIDVHVNDRMTDGEMDRFKERAKKLLGQVEARISTYPIDYLRAYGSQRRIGIRMSPGNDPLGNGIITGNFDGFDVEAVKPVDHETVYIRFQEVSD